MSKSSSNIIFSNLITFQNIDKTLCNLKSVNFDNLISDYVKIGSSNRFITNDIYDRDINFTKTLFSSNIITSNLSVIGDTTILNTTLYETEQLQIVNETNATAIITKQKNINYNVVEFYNDNENAQKFINLVLDKHELSCISLL